MKYSKLSAITSGVPIIVTLVWLVLGMYFLNNSDRRNYTGIFLLILLGAIVMGCYYAFKSLKEKRSVYKIIGISLNGIYIAGILYVFIMNIIDVEKTLYS